MNQIEEVEPLEEGTERKSKTKIKQEMHDLQKLGERLAKLSPEQIQPMDLPPSLVQSLELVRNIKSRAAHRRELKHIGGLLRKVDIDPILEAFEVLDQKHLQNSARFKKHEKWRNTLVEGDESVLTEIKESIPELDTQKVRQLGRKARKEKEQGKTSGASRELFRYFQSLDP